MRTSLKSLFQSPPALSRLSLLHKGLLLVAIPLVCQLIFLSGLGFVLIKENAEKQRARHAEAVVSTVTRLLDRYYSAGRALLGYSATKSPVFESHFNDAAAELPTIVTTLVNLVADNKKEAELVARIKVLDQRVEAFLTESKASIDSGGSISVFFEPNQMDDELRALLLPTSSLVKEVIAQEETSADGNQSAEYWTNAVKMFILVGVPLDMIVSIGLALMIYRSTASRLRVLMDNSARLAQQQPLNPPLEGDDEIASVDRTFHDSAKSIARVNEFKRDFVNMISHDLRSPLSTVQLLLEILDDRVSPQDPSSGKMIASGLAQIERMLALANQLLDVEKLAGGQFDLKIQSIDVHEMLSDSSAAISQLASSMGIAIEVSKTDVHALADGQRIVQVIDNLLSNALKFSPRASTIHLTASRIEGQNMVRIDVVDEGRGIPIGMEESVFERFKQVTAADQTKAGGVGLGLFICKSIVEQHGGKITAKRNETAGTTMSFTLPESQALQP